MTDIIETCILPYVKQMASASSMHEAGHPKQVLQDNPEGWGGEGGGWGLRIREMHMYLLPIHVDVWQKPLFLLNQATITKPSFPSGLLQSLPKFSIYLASFSDTILHTTTCYTLKRDYVPPLLLLNGFILHLKLHSNLFHGLQSLAPPESCLPYHSYLRALSLYVSAADWFSLHFPPSES